MFSRKLNCSSCSDLNTLIARICIGIVMAYVILTISVALILKETRSIHAGSVVQVADSNLDYTVYEIYRCCDTTYFKARARDRTGAVFWVELPTRCITKVLSVPSLKGEKDVSH